jgi:hypothetical protein
MVAAVYFTDHRWVYADQWRFNRWGWRGWNKRLRWSMLSAVH